MNLLSGPDRQAIESHLGNLLDRLCPTASLQPVCEAVRQFVLSGGKRLRPQLCVWTWQGFTGSRATPALLDLACAWELFHAFLLIHDDIIDAADTRRARPCLHETLRGLDHGSRHFGRSLAIVAGDLLFAESLRLVHEGDLPAPAYRAAVRLFSRIARTTGFGQVIDICQAQVPLAHVDECTLLREYHWKTAAYTFEGPMLCGAIVANATEGSQAALSRYALALGQAYQMHNDLVDLATPARDGCDLLQGKRTVTLLRYRAGLADGERGQLDQRLGELPSLNGHAIEAAESLRREIVSSDAPRQTAARIDALLDEAHEAADDSALPDAMRQGLGGVLSVLRATYFQTSRVGELSPSPPYSGERAG